jgi:iron-sulfur cluster assembly accessory protein
MTVSLTDRAASELRALLAGRAISPMSGLRLAVVPGGCAGWQYEMKVADPQDGDQVCDKAGARVIVSADSIPFLVGSQIDYIDDLSDSGFRVINPNASRSCGCGTSFESVDSPSDQLPVADGEVCGNN